jgi:hypothetical protein
MKSRLLLLALPLFFFACEADDEEAIEETTTLVGLWTVTSYVQYSEPTCTGTPEWGLDSLTAMFGDGMTIAMDFTADAVSMNMNLTADALCSILGATVDGDSCLSEHGNLATADVCVMLDGTYANSTCTMTEDSSVYTTVDDAITMTTYAGTDSAEVQTGTWSISGDVLTLSLADSSSCANYTLSK